MTREQLAHRLGTKVVAARQRNGINQKTLAKKIGIGSPFMCEIEKGKTVPSLHLLHKIESVVGPVWWDLPAWWNR